MREILFHYEAVNPTTWSYLSSLLTIGLFFKFSRFWSVRNLDLVLLILFAPGLLIIHSANRTLAEAETMVAFEKASGMMNDEAILPEVVVDPALEQSEDSSPDDADATEPDSGLPTADTPSDGNASTDGISDDTKAEETESNDDGAAETPVPIDTGNSVDAPPSPPAVTSPRTETDTAADNNLDTSFANDDAASTIDTDSASPQYAPQPKTTPGTELLASSIYYKRIGYLWMLGVTAIAVLRLLLDPTMVRRPLLEPNLSTGGLTFIGCSLFVFLTANIISGTPTESDLKGPRSAEKLLTRTTGDASDLQAHGPGYALLSAIPSIATVPVISSSNVEGEDIRFAAVSKIIAILSHLAVVFGLVVVGYRHFDNIKMGIGAATLYLMMPYTAQMTGRIDHVIPAALLLWAIVLYRRPLSSGICIGLAGSVVYYPLFLLPLWISFYWHRGLGRFVTGVAATLLVMALSLMFVSENSADYWLKLKSMFGLWSPIMSQLEGIWGLGWNPIYRLPILTTFCVLSTAFALWPAQKNLGTLLSCSAAIMAASQFWHGHGAGGGVYMAWYLPLLLLTIFRPNLEDRIALSVLGEGWLARRRSRGPIGEKAA